MLADANIRGVFRFLSHTYNRIFQWGSFNVNFELAIEIKIYNAIYGIIFNADNKTQSLKCERRFS